MVEDHESATEKDPILAGAEQPLISVITVCFNAVDTIDACLESVRNSPNIEHIVIDGGSTDGTIDRIKTHEQGITKWLSESDGGIYHAMNKGIDLANGKLIAFLNADDRYPENALELVAKSFQEKDADIYYGDMYKSREVQGEEKRIKIRPDLTLMPRTMGLFHPATFIKREVFERIGCFDERYRFSADYDLLLRAYLAQCTFHYINEPLAIFRVGGKSGMDHRSYVEGYRILKEHKTGHHKAMRDLIIKAWVKEKLFKLTNGGRIFGERAVERRIQQKWATE